MRWQTLKVLNNLLMACLSLTMSVLTWETRAVGAAPDADPKKGVCPKHLTLKAQTSSNSTTEGQRGMLWEKYYQWNWQ